MLNSPPLPKALLVVLFSFCSAVGMEFLSWLLVYRTDKFKHTKMQLQGTDLKLEVCP